MSTTFDEEALPCLDAVYRFALRLTRSHEDAEDLVQETFLRAYRAWDQYTPGTRCKSWLFTIARNLHVRQSIRRRRYDEIMAEKTPPDLTAEDSVNPLWRSVGDTDPEREFFDSVVDQEVLRAIDELPEEYRTAIILSDVEGLRYHEIAELMGIPLGTVKSRLFRGRQKLQEALFEYGAKRGLVGTHDADA